LDNQFSFLSTERKIERLEADFGSGLKYKLIDKGKFNTKKVEIEYTENGYKILTFIVTYSDGSKQTTYGRIHVKKPTILADPLLEDAPRLKSTIPFKGYDETVTIYGEIDYRTYYRTSGGNTNRNLLKPIIIIDGFDPQDRRKFDDADSPLPANEHRSISEIMTYPKNGIQTSLITELRALGYDVILVNQPTYTTNGKQIDGGADYIERNAMNLVTLINTLNAKLNINGSSEKLVLAGPSMGGQISRYALAYMEKMGLNHNTRLWVSIDSPHLGANVPLGLQALLFQLRDKSAKAKDFFDNQLRSIASKQQLIEQYNHILNVGPDPSYLNGRVTAQGYTINSGAPFFKTYYNNLFTNGLAGSQGYPKNLRKIALVNGSLSGSKEYYDQNSGIKISYASSWQKVLDLKGFTSATTTLLVGMETYFMPNYNTKGLIVRYSQFGKPDEAFEVTNQNSRGNMDNVPGGWFPSQQDFAKPTLSSQPNNVSGGFWTYPLENILSGFIELLGGNRWETRSLSNNNSFISTFSAIGHKSPDRDWAQALNRNLVCSGETPFDSYFGFNENTGHTTFTKESVDWLLKELANTPQEPYFPPSAANLVGNTTLCEGATAAYTFSGCNAPGSVETWTVSSNIQKISSTGNSVTLKTPVGARGEGWVTATFKNGATVTKKIKVGKPLVNIPDGADLCLNIRDQQDQYSLPISLGADTYKLVSSSPNFRINGSTSFTTSNAPITLRYSATRAGTYTVTLTTTNGCGSSVVNYSVRAINCSSGGVRNLFIVSPNPANTEIYIDNYCCPIKV
jgi:pimeloyl-ACP methyl ester carboxylesterase